MQASVFKWWNMQASVFKWWNMQASVSYQCSSYIFGHCSLTSFYQVNNTVTEHEIQRWPIHCISTQCRLSAWARWTVARGSHEDRAMLIYVCCVWHVFLRFKHWLLLKYQYNKYMFNLIMNYSFITMSGGCVGTGPSALLSSGAYHTVKMALSLLV